MISKFPLLKEYDSNGIQYFVDHYIFINILIISYWDYKDPSRRWIIILILGDFSERELYIPELNIIIPYQNGDMIFL
jgi:hypothetical protein